MAIDFRAKKTIGNGKSKLKLKFTGFIKKMTRRNK